MNKPKLRKVSWDDIHVDHTVQRDQKGRWVSELASDFQESWVGVPVLSLRADGKHYSIDCQHRRAAAIAAGRGHERITCEVFEGLTIAEEAELFHVRNHTKQVDKFDDFRARLQYDETAIEVKRILDKHSITLSKGSRTPGTVKAVDSLEYAFGLGVLDNGLMAVEIAGWQRQPDVHTPHIIRAIALVLHSFPSITVQALGDALAKSAPRIIITEGRSLHVTGALWKDVARAIVTQYNKGKRVGRVDERELKA